MRKPEMWNALRINTVMSPNYLNSKLSFLLTVTVTCNAFQENYFKAEKYLQMYVTSVVNLQPNLHTDRIQLLWFLGVVEHIFFCSWWVLLECDYALWKSLWAEGWFFINQSTCSPLTCCLLFKCPLSLLFRVTWGVCCPEWRAVRIGPGQQ